MGPEMQKKLQKTVLHDWHISAGARMLEFGGFDMPVQYQTIFAEHIATRLQAGLFDVCHMGRFQVSGHDAVAFLQYATTNNVLALDQVGKAQYTLIPDGDGNAVDDAYLYRTGLEEYLLVVNASNRGKDWEWLTQHLPKFRRVAFLDKSEEIAMLALQGPESERLLEEILNRAGNSGRLPDAFRNAMSFVRINGSAAIVSRTGYTGEPTGFELFTETASAVSLWEQILEVGREAGAVPVGLGARDTLRLEAGLPLYGHELGTDPAGDAIPICALSLGRRCTSFVQAKGDYVGREALVTQHREVVQRLRQGGRFAKPIGEKSVPRFVRPVAVLDSSMARPGIIPARQGEEVYLQGRPVGWVSSGTVVPYMRFEGEGLFASPTEEQDRRAIALVYVDSAVISGKPGQYLEIQKARNRSAPAVMVDTNLRVAPPYARVILHPESRRSRRGKGRKPPSAEAFQSQAVENTAYRQSKAINLIPSEQSPSLFVRLLSILDPVGRYAEHRAVKAFGRASRDVFYYQGTGFIDWVEETLQMMLSDYLGSTEVEVRPVSGQMANKAVFSGLVDYVNRFSRQDLRRLRCVMNNHLNRGGHLSAQYLGALRHFVQMNASTERPALAHFPILKDNPYKIDVEKTLDLIERHRPELIVFGKSMVLHPEPLRPIAEFVAHKKDRPILMYDMAHVLGLMGGHFQQPFEEGADIVTGSTHKTFFGPQRGIIASRMSEFTYYRPLWEQIVKEVFPGDVSNHHLGTLLALLGACYEMRSVRDGYQRQVLANAKAFAVALKDNGVSVEGDASSGYTETHQVILHVGHCRGPKVAKHLEENNIITNYQALPGDASFSDASGIRLGTQEMTRFGMVEGDFQELAGYMADAILRDKRVGERVSTFRERFTTMTYCLPASEELIYAALGQQIQVRP